MSIHLGLLYLVKTFYFVFDRICECVIKSLNNLHKIKPTYSFFDMSRKRKRERQRHRQGEREKEREVKREGENEIKKKL